MSAEALEALLARGSRVREADLMSARRCIHTGVTLPECSCLSCNREKVRRYAPELIAGGRRRRRVVIDGAPTVAGEKR